ncbi:unnamed protein product [Lampetra planeri]
MATAETLMRASSAAVARAPRGDAILSDPPPSIATVTVRSARGYRFKEEEIEIASVRRINKLLRPSTNRWRGGRRHSPPVAFPPAAVAAAGHPARPRRTSWTTFSAGRWRDGVCQDRLQDDLRCVPTTPSVIVATQTWTGATASCAGGVQCTCRGNVDAKFHIALPSIAKSFDFMKELQKEIRET